MFRKAIEDEDLRALVSFCEVQEGDFNEANQEFSAWGWSKKA